MTGDSNRTRRWEIGPVEIYAYHDYSTAPWRSPLYTGVRVGDDWSTEIYVSPDSRLRPFSGES